MTSNQVKKFFIYNNRGKGNNLSGILRFKDFTVKTPTFMPVGTRGAVKGLSVDQVRLTGAKILLGNTYHLFLSPGEKMVERLGGLAAMNHWPGPTLTDSGGFQVFSLGKINKISDEGVWFINQSNGDKVFLSPEKSMQIQHKLGADIIMAFDDVIGLDKLSRARADDAMKRTHLWLDRSIAEHRRLSKYNENKPKLFGIVQGGLKKRLRKKSYEYIASKAVDGIAIGGLAVGETRQEMNTMLDYLQPLFDTKRPHYLMGVGHPTDMKYAINRGIDMFDSVLPTRNGRHGSFWHHSCCNGAACHQTQSDALPRRKTHSVIKASGIASKYLKYSSVHPSALPRSSSLCSLCDPVRKKLVQSNIKRSQFKNDLGPLEKGCDCSVCKDGYARSYLRHLIRQGETLGGSLISIHNLRYVQRICESFQS